VQSTGQLLDIHTMYFNPIYKTDSLYLGVDTNLGRQLAPALQRMHAGTGGGVVNAVNKISGAPWVEADGEQLLLPPPPAKVSDVIAFIVVISQSSQL
jgi:hypothetical protein